MVCITDNGQTPLSDMHIKLFSDARLCGLYGGYPLCWHWINNRSSGSPDILSSHDNMVISQNDLGHILIPWISKNLHYKSTLVYWVRHWFLFVEIKLPLLSDFPKDIHAAVHPTNLRGSMKHHWLQTTLRPMAALLNWMRSSLDCCTLKMALIISNI